MKAGFHEAIIYNVDIEDTVNIRRPSKAGIN
jgi:hypothetical protein